MEPTAPDSEYGTDDQETDDVPQFVQAGPSDDESPIGPGWDYYECPECGTVLEDWTDCPNCDWFDEDAWKAGIEAAKRAGEGA